MYPQLAWKPLPCFIYIKYILHLNHIHLSFTVQCRQINPMLNKGWNKSSFLPTNPDGRWSELWLIKCYWNWGWSHFLTTQMVSVITWMHLWNLLFQMFCLKDSIKTLSHLPANTESIYHVKTNNWSLTIKPFIASHFMPRTQQRWCLHWAHYITLMYP